MSDRPDFAIKIDDVFESKGIHLPKPVLFLINRFFHLDFLNEYFVKGYEGVEFCTKGLECLGIKLDVTGIENIPDDGTLYTFVSNHPLGGIDGVALGSIVGTHFGGKIRYIVNDFLMLMKGFAPICVPVNKVGGQSRNLPKLIDDAFNSDNQMILFPAGICSRKIDGKIQDLPWTKAFISKSRQTGRSIVPVHFIAQNSKRFYRIANLQKKIGLKVNIAMAFLPDEMYRQRGQTFKVIIGKPIPSTFFDDSKSASQWAQWVREEVYKL